MMMVMLILYTLGEFVLLALVVVHVQYVVVPIIDPHCESDGHEREYDSHSTESFITYAEICFGVDDGTEGEGHEALTESNSRADNSPGRPQYLLRHQERHGRGKRSVIYSKIE